MTNTLKIIPLGGGPGTVTNNMYLYQLGQDALIVDCGIGFPDDKASDDILIPDITYLKNNNLRLHGIIITHGHDDHHAALSYILPEINFPPVFGSRLTAGLAQAKLKEFKINHKIKVIKSSDRLNLGPFSITPIHVTHSIPNTFHFFIHTPIGNFYHGSDFKFDLTPFDHQPPDFQKIVKLAHSKILCLLSDCLRGERSGFTPSETSLMPSLERELTNYPGRLIFTTMSSQIHRIQQAVNVAITSGRKIAFIGRSMEKTTEVARHLGFLKYPQKVVLNKSQLNRISDNKLCLIVAGSQGQESSSLSRYANNTHRLIKVKPTDKVIYSVDIIPGNEQPVYDVIDQLSQAGASVVYQENVKDLHASGHASASELQLLMLLTKPQYLLPFGGSFRHMRQYQKLSIQLGFLKDQIILPHQSQIVEFTKDGNFRLAETLKLKQVRINQQRH